MNIELCKLKVFLPSNSYILVERQEIKAYYFNSSSLSVSVGILEELAKFLEVETGNGVSSKVCGSVFEYRPWRYAVELISLGLYNAQLVKIQVDAHLHKIGGGTAEEVPGKAVSFQSAPYFTNNLDEPFWKFPIFLLQTLVAGCLFVACG